MIGLEHQEEVRFNSWRVRQAAMTLN